MNNENRFDRAQIASALIVIAFYAAVFAAEQVLPPTSMLFTVLKKGAVYALVAVAMNLLNGFTGIFSLGQAGFMLVGAYAYAVLTIPEAAQLVMEAGAIAKQSQIFVLDMGEPVKILDLAENLIKLSGYKVGEDIQIKFTGLRPGEKLYEEILMDEEGMKETPNSLIYIGRPIEIDEDVFFSKLKELSDSSRVEGSDIRPIVKSLVPTYHYEDQES